MKRFAAVLVGVLLAGGVTFAAGPEQKADAGQAAYTTLKCGTCHAIKGTGGKLASALDGVGAKLSAADLKKWLTDPVAMEAKLEKKPKMLMSASLKNKKLTPEDIDNLVAYMATLK
jgi:mono/diheme cytochrome c family protein